MNRQVIILFYSISITCAFGQNDLTSDSRLAILIRYPTNDTSMFNLINLSQVEHVGINVLVSQIDYPPRIPKNFRWTYPKTELLNQKEKQELTTKYEFDESGKVVLYFYEGSFTSGISPVGYHFLYDEEDKLLTKIENTDYNFEYNINYDGEGNIRSIEKFGEELFEKTTRGQLTEKLLILEK